jgi:hypothetical protein
MSKQNNLRHSSGNADEELPYNRYKEGIDKVNFGSLILKSVVLEDEELLSQTAVKAKISLRLLKQELMYLYYVCVDYNLHIMNISRIVKTDIRNSFSAAWRGRIAEVDPHFSEELLNARLGQYMAAIEKATNSTPDFGIHWQLGNCLARLCAAENSLILILQGGGVYTETLRILIAIANEWGLIQTSQ